MAKFGPGDFALTLEDAPGGTARALRVINQQAYKIVSRMMDETALGDDWDVMTPTGRRAVEPIPVVAVFDDTSSTGSQAVLEIQDADASPDSAGRELVAVIGSSAATFTVTGHLTEYEVSADPSGGTNLQVINAVLQPSGAGVWS